MAVNNIPGDPPAVTTNKPLEVDLFSTQVKTGLEVPEILSSMTPEDELIPLMPKESYQEELGSQFASQQDYDSLYNDTVDKYDLAKLAQFRKNLVLTGSEKLGIGEDFDPLYGQHTSFSINTKADSYDPIAHDNPLYIETPSQNASRNNLSVQMQDKFNKRTRQFEKVPVYGDRPGFMDRYLGDYYIAPQLNEDGSAVRDNRGRIQYMYQDSGDGKPNYNLEKASIWGDQKVYGTSVINAAMGLISTATMDLLQSGAQMGRIVNDVVGYNLYGDAYPVIKDTLGSQSWGDANSMARAMGSVDRFYDMLIDSAETFKWKPTAELEKTKFFGTGLAGFTYQLGVGLGYIVPQRAAASLLGKTASKVALRLTSTGIGTSQAINGGYRAAREAGLSEKDAAHWSIAAMPAVAITEWMFNSKWLTRGLGNDEVKAVAKAIEDTNTGLAKAGIDVATEKGRALSVKGTFNKLLKNEGFLEFLQGKRIAGPALMEGMQEGSEEVIYGLLERAYDLNLGDKMGLNLDGPTGIPGEGSFGTKINSEQFRRRIGENFIGGLVVGGVMDATMLGQKDRYRAKVFEEMIVRGDTQKLLNYVTKNFQEGKLGPTHHDITDSVMFADENGDPQGETFSVPEDIIFDGTTYFRKDQTLSNANEFNYYNMVRDIIVKNETATKAGITDPEVLHAFTGQESLLADAFSVVQESENITAQISQLEAQKNEEGVDLESVDAKINELTVLRDGITETITEEDGTTKEVVTQEGLKQRWDYLMNPVQGSKHSQAYIDNVKNAMFNGYVYNEDKAKYEAGLKSIPYVNKETTKLLDANMESLKTLRENYTKETGQKLFERESDFLNTVAKTIQFARDEGNVPQDIVTRLSKDLDYIISNGIDERTLDVVTENIQKLASEFSNEVKSLFKEKGLEFEDDLSVDQRAMVAGVEIDANDATNLGSLEDLAILGNKAAMLSETLDPNQIRSKNAYTLDMDKKYMSEILFIANLGNGEFVSVKDIVNDLKARAKTALDDPGVAEDLGKAMMALESAKLTMKWAEKMQASKSDPNYSEVLAADTPTIFRRGQVIPGKDIPYLDELKEEANQLENDIRELAVQARKDAQDNAFSEKRRRVASISKKSRMLNHVFNNNAVPLATISESINQLNALRDQILSDPSGATEADMIDVEKIISQIETDIFDKAKNDKSLHKTLLQGAVVNYGEGYPYVHSREFNYNYIESKDGRIRSASEMTQEEIDNSLEADQARSIFVVNVTNYINNMVAVPSNNFNKFLKDFTDKDGDTVTKKPGIEQIEAIRSILTVTVGNKINPSFQFLVRNAKGQIGAYVDDEAIMSIHKLNAVHIDGSGGTGKTSVVTNTAMGITDMFFRELGVTSKVVVAGPSTELTENLSSNVRGNENIPLLAATTTDALMKNPNNFLSSNETIFVIDESSRITIESIMQFTKKMKDKNVAVIFLGDSSQATPMYNGIVLPNVPAMSVGIRVPKMNMKFRSGIADIGVVQDAIDRSMKGIYSEDEITFPSVRYNTSHTKGVRYVATKDEVIEQWKKDVTSPEGSERYIIFETESEANAFKKKNEGNNALLPFLKNVKHVISNKTSKDPEGTVQGLELPFVYVAIEDPGGPVDGQSTSMIYKRRIYLTAQSRAQKFSMLPVYSAQVNKSLLAQDENIIDQSEELEKENDARAVEAKTRIDVLADGSTNANITPNAQPSDALPKKRRTKKVKKEVEVVPQPQEVKESISLPDSIIESVNDSEIDRVELDEGVKHKTRFKNSAINFANTGVIPVMPNIQPADLTEASIPTDDFFRNNRNRETLLGEYDLVFFSEIVLYTDNGKGAYESKTHYNVLALSDGDNVVGVLPRPDINFNDTNSATKMFSSQKKVDFSEKNRLDNTNKVSFENDSHTTVLNNYHKHLVGLHTDAYEMAKGGNNVVVGKMAIKNAQGGKAIYDNNVRPIEELLNEAETEGFNIVGGRTRPRVIQRRNKATGFMETYMEGSYLESADKYPIAIHVIPRVLNNEDIKDINESLKTIVPGETFAAALNRSIAFQTILSNTAKILDVNSAVKPEYRKFLSVDNGRLDVIGMRDKKINDSTTLSNLKSAINQLKKDHTVSKSFRRWQKSTSLGENMEVLEDLTGMETRVKQINSPQYSGSIEMNQIDSSPTTNKMSQEELDDEEMTKFLLESTDTRPVFTTVARGISYINQVLGEEYVKDFLSISTARVAYNKRYWGYVKGLQMVLREVTGPNLNEKAFRHEPVHIIMTYLMDPKKRRQVLDASKKDISEKLGVPINEISDDIAEENVANLHMNKQVLKKQPKKGLSGILDRFVNWLGKFFNNLQSYHTILNEFMADIEAGAYANKIGSISQNEMRGTQVKFLQDIESSDLAKNNNQKYHNLATNFGDHVMLHKATNVVINKIKFFSGVNGRLDNHTGGFLSGVTKARLAFEDYSRANFLVPKFKDTTATTLDENKYYDDSNVERMFILSKLGDRDVFNTIVKHVFPGADIVNDNYIETFNKGYEESISLDPELVMGDIIKHHLKTLPYYNYTSSGRKSTQTGEFVNYDLLKIILVEAMTVSREFGNNNIPELLSTLQKMADQYNDPNTEHYDNESRNTILSFLEVFGKEIKSRSAIRNVIEKQNAKLTDPTEVRPTFSYYMLAHKTDKILAEVTSPQLKEIIRKKSKLANDILNGIMASMNLRRYNTATIIADRKPEGFVFKRNIFRENSLAYLVNSMKGGMDSKFNTLTGYRKGIKGIVTGKSGRGVIYNVERNNITQNNRGEILQYNDNNTFSFTAPKIDDVIKDAVTLGVFFGLNVKESTWRHMLTNPEVQRKFNIDESTIASYFGHMLSTIRYSPEHTSEENFDFVPVQERLNKFANKNNFLLDDPLGPTPQGEYVTLKLSDFHPFIENVAKIQSFITGKVSPMFTKTVKGQNKPNMKLPSLLAHTFANVEGENASDKVTANLRDNILRNALKGNVADSNVSPWITIEKGIPTYNDPLLDPSSGMDIQYIEEVGGMTNQWNASELNDFTKTDYYNMALSGFFKESVFKNRSNQLLQILPENLGDSGTLPLFHVKFGARNSNLIDVKYDEGWQGTLNNDLINSQIEYGFDYAHKSMLISINKWYNHFVNNGQKFKTKIDQGKYLESQVSSLMKVKSEIQKLIDGDSASIQTQENMINKSGLSRVSDYRIEDGKITFGRATNMEHDIFNLENYNKFKGAKNKTEVRDYMFRNRFANLRNDIISNKVTLSKEAAGIMGDIRKFTKETKKYEYNPFYSAFMYSYFIANNSISNFTIGNYTQFNDAIEKSKRNKVMNSSGQKPIIGGTYNLPEKTYLLRISDTVLNYNELALFGENSFIEITDGLELILPIVRNQLTSSLGGINALSQYNDNTIKAIHHGKDWKENRSDQNKFAQLVINEDFADLTEIGDQIIKMMLTSGPNVQGKDLYQMYKDLRADGLSFDQAMRDISDYIGENNLHDSYVGIISFDSANKSNSGRVNNIPLSSVKVGADVVLDERNNDGLFFQLNLNHPLDLDVSRGNQLEALIGVPSGNAFRAELVDLVNAELLNRKESQISDSIQKTNIRGEDNKIKEYMRILGASAVEKIGTANMTGDLFANRKLNMSLPMMMHQGMQAYVSNYNKGINPRAVGTKMVQMPSMFELYEEKDDLGNVYYANKKESSKGSKKAGPLKHYRFLDKNGGDITENLLGEYDGNYREDIATYQKAYKALKEMSLLAEYTAAQQKQLDKYQEVLDTLSPKIKDFMSKVKSSIDFVSPSQIAMGFPYMDKFNILEGETVNDALTITLDGKKLNVKAHLKNVLGEKAYFDRVKRNKEIESSVRDLISASEKFEFKGMENVDDVIEYFKSLTDALNVVYTRTPTSLLSSSAYAEIVMFTNNSQNTIYIPAEKNILDGSDFDIDELSVFFKHVNDSGTVELPNQDTFDPESLGSLNDNELNNLKHEMLYQTFSDPKNIDYITTSVDIQGLRDKVEAKRKLNTLNQDNDFPTSAANFIASQEGKNMVARFANSIIVLSRLSRIASTNPEIIPGFTFGENVIKDDVDLVTERTNFVLTNMARVLQASVDNAKEMILGYLNINRASGNIVSALVMSNYSEEEIVNFLNDPAVAPVIQETYESYSITELNKEFIDVINRKIRFANVNKLEQPAEQRILEHERRIRFVMNKLQKEKEGDFAVTLNEQENQETPEYYNDPLWDSALPVLDQELIDLQNEELKKDISERERSDVTNKINKKISKLASKLSNNKEYLREVEQASRENASKYIDTLNVLRDMYYKGQFIWRLSQGFSLYRGLPVKEYDQYLTTTNLEFNMGSTLDQFIDGDETNFGWMGRADNLAGKDVADQLFNSQEDVDSYISDVVDAITSKFKPGDFQVIVGNSRGFESGLSSALKARGFDVQVTTTENGAIFNPYGSETFEFAEDENVLKLEGVRSEYGVRNSNANRSDFAINFDATNRGADNISNAFNVIPTRANTDHIDNAVKAISSKLNAYKPIDGLPFKLNLSGTSLYKLHTRDKTPYERFIEDETEIRKNGNIASIFRAIPNIKSYIGALNNVNKDFGVYYRHNELFHALEETMMDMQNIDVFSPQQYIQFHNALDEFVIDMYFNETSPVFDLSTDSEKLITAGRKDNKAVDLKKFEDREYFVSEFPELVRDIQENAAHSLNGNPFISALVYNNGGLQFDETFLDNGIKYKQAFDQIARENPELAEMFKVYNLLAYGFGFRNGSYRQVIGSSFFEDLSSFIVGMESDMKSLRRNGTKDKFQKYFIDNAVMTMETLQPIQNEGFDLKLNSGIVPRYSRKKEYNEYIDPFTGRTVRTSSYWQTYRHLSPTESEKVYANSSRRVKAIPSNRFVESRNEVVRIVDPQNFRDLRSLTSKSTTVSFRKKHNYEPGEVFVMGKRAKLTLTPDSNSIGLRIVDNNPDYNFADIKRDRAFERSSKRLIELLGERTSLSLNLNRAITRFDIFQDEGIDFNPRGIRINHSKIKDLGLINASLLESIDQNLFDSIVEMAKNDDILKNYSDYEAVSELLSNEDILVSEDNTRILNNAREFIVSEISTLLSDTYNPEIKFDTTISDMFSILKDKIKSFHGSEYYAMLNEANLQLESEEDLLSSEAAKEVIDRLERQFGVQGTIVSDSDARQLLKLNAWEKTPNGFFANGKAHVVEGKIHKDTPFHEFIHPFVDAIEKSNPTLYNNLLNQLRNSDAGKRVLEYVGFRYQSSTNTDIEKEALVQLMGQNAARVIPPKKNKGLVGSLNRFWRWISSQVKSLFKTSKMPSRINPNVSIGELSNMIARGDSFFLGKINSNVYFQKDSDLNLSDLDNDLLMTTNLKGKVKDFSDKRELAMVSKIYKTISIDPDKEYVIRGKKDITIEFKKDWLKGEAFIKQRIIDEILPGIEESNQLRQDTIVNWLNNVDPATNGAARLDSATIKKFFGNPNNRSLLYEYEVLRQIKNLIGYNPNMRVLKYSELNEYFKDSKFANMFNETYKDEDPLVVLHKVIETDGQISDIELSVIDLGFRTLKVTANKGLGLFTNYIDESDAENMRINLKSNVADLKKFKLGMIAAKMKAAGGENIVIRKVGAVSVFKNNYEAHMVDMIQMVDILNQVSGIEEFVDKLSPDLRALILNKELLNTQDYQVDFIQMMRNVMLSDKTYFEDTYGNDNKQSAVLDEQLDVIDKYINGVGSELDLINVLKYRRQRLDNKLRSLDKKKTSEEYWIISEILGSLQGYKPNSIKNKPTKVDTKDAGVWAEWARSIHDVRSNILQDMYAIMRRTSKEITGVYNLEYKDIFREKLKPLDRLWVERKGKDVKITDKFVDIGWQRFDKLWKKKDVVGTDGKSYSINTFEIHTEWNSDAKALGITKEEIDFANYVADTVEKYMKQMIRHEALKSSRFHLYDDKGFRQIDEKSLDAFVNGEYNKNWKRGMLPIMEKAPSEHLASGQVGIAGKKFVKRMGNPVEEFDEVLELSSQEGSDQNVRSHFLNQYFSSDVTEFGTAKRMEMLGLDSNDSAQVVVKMDSAKGIDGSKQNSMLTHNIEEIMDFFVMDVLWKTGMEEKVIPEYVSAKVRLTGLVNLYGGRQIANERHMDTMFKKIVQGQYELEHESKEWKNTATVLNLIYKMTTFNGVALSVPVAITSGVGNLTEANLHALASSVANPYNTFNWKEFQKAQWVMMKNSNLVNKLTDFYQITENERFDLLSNQRFKETKNDVFNPRAMHILNWLTDYHVRQLVMVAQMMHDGSWDAHSLDSSGNVVYDAKKDTRFYNTDGSFAKTNPDGSLSSWVSRNLTQDKRVNQPEGADPVRGYDLEDQGKFEWISSYFVTGTYNKESTGKFDSYILAKLVAQFKKFLISKIELRMGAKTVKKEGGWKVIVTENGKNHEIWQDLETEGAYRSAFNYLMDNVLTPLFKGEIKDISKMTEMQKYNSVRTGMDALMFAATWLLFTGLGKIADDKEKKASISALYDIRLIAALQNGFLTALAVTPTELAKAVGIPVAEQAKRLINIATFNGTSTDFKRSLPLGATVDSFQDVIDLTE